VSRWVAELLIEIKKEQQQEESINFSFL
jgi:hypothetical protein